MRGAGLNIYSGVLLRETIKMSDYRKYAGSHFIGGPRIAVIGGGTGQSVILRGLKKQTSNISAIVTMSDDGGGSGVLREELGMLPPGDVRNCILALADNEDIMEKLLQYRFTDGRLKGQNMGNLVISAMTDIYGDFEKAVNRLQRVLRIKGKVIPVTTDDVVLCARLKNGEEIRGESSIPGAVMESGSPIEEVYMDPEDPEALSAAISAIKSADAIILGPGSLFTSIIPNLLVDGIARAVRNASGKKFLVCNVMTQPGETDNYSVMDFVRAAEQYLGRGVIEYVLINDRVCSESEIAKYLEAGTSQILASADERKELREMGIIPIESNLIRTDGGFLRHDADRLAEIVMSLLG